MRHLYGTALAVVLTGVMFFAGGWGYHQLLGQSAMPGQPGTLPAGGGSLLSDSSALLALSAVAATGLLAGLFILVSRLSPLAAGLPGLLLLAWTGLYLVSVRRAVDLIPLRTLAFGAGWQALLGNGLLSAAGVVLVLPLFVPARWRSSRPGREAVPGSSAHEADDYLASVRADAPPWPRNGEPELVGTVLPRDTGGIPRPAAGAFVPAGPANGAGPATTAGPANPGGPAHPAGATIPADTTSPLDTASLLGVTRPVDTTRVTGASRALRNTASFRGVPNPYAPHRQDPKAPGSR